MRDLKGYIKIKRKKPEYRPVCERVKDFSEVSILRKLEHSIEQSLRCMDCGTPFCHWGCPLGNIIPEWNYLLSNNKIGRAAELLQSTNNFPEFTGRICPAICEYACVLGINDEAVTNRENELAIVENAFKQGFIKANPPGKRTGKKIAVVGSGPAGLACADQLNKYGHHVTVFERDEKAGGILRYGIPDFKLGKNIIDRRLEILKKEGIKFKTKVNIGVDKPVADLKEKFDAICLAGGSRSPRDLKIDGRELKGIYFAMDFLIQANLRNEGKRIPKDKLIDAKGKNVVVIGGGDTGADCIGVSHRQGAKCVVQLEILPCPPGERTGDFPWPKYPMLFKTSTSHEEGGERKWSVLTKKFTGENGYVKKIICVNVEWQKDAKGSNVMKEIPCTGFEIDADLVILALGFVHPEHEGLVRDSAVGLDTRGNVKTDSNYLTSQEGIFACGDMRRGQSLVVWAIAEGRNCAKAVDEYLKNKSI
ncbi:MAG: glutamate synthase subunit beta [bacterium]